jgi:hypothetical protein
LLARTIAAVLIAGFAVAAAAPASPLVGQWKVVGCETSPRDPADCGRGEIVFTGDRVTIAVPRGPGTTRPYKVVATTADVVEVDVGGEVSKFVLDGKGGAHWRAPGLGGRVGTLSLKKSVPDRNAL